MLSKNVKIDPDDLLEENLSSFKLFEKGFCEVIET
jgi:hypothetical protein